MNNTITFNERFHAAIKLMAAEISTMPNGDWDNNELTRTALKQVDYLISESGCKLEKSTSEIEKDINSIYNGKKDYPSVR